MTEASPSVGEPATRNGVSGRVETASFAAAVPRLVIESLLEDTRRPPHWIDSIEGSLLLADISGFTPLSERLAQMGNEGAEWLTTIINSYFERMLDVAKVFGGDNLKFGGDALLVLFRGDGHARRAVAAALKMQRANRQFGAIQVGRERVRLRMSIGAHSGQFWSATVGVPGLRMQHLVIGRDVALVAEAQRVASAGEVVITGETRGRVSEMAAFEPREGFYRVVRALKPPRSQVTAGDEATLASTPDQPPALAAGVEKALASWRIRSSQEGEHRKVSVVFVSLRGANELIEQTSPAMVLDELNQYVSAAARLAERHGGYLLSNDVDSHGVKLIVVFGAPVAQEHHAANALRMALALKEEPLRMNLHLTHRVGVNSGYVFCGEVGASYRREYTILGDSVNLSARLMANARDAQILISEQTANEAGPRFVTHKLAPLSVKGKARPVAVRSLQTEIVSSRRLDRRTKLLGRDREMAKLRELCRVAEDGGGPTVLLVGEAGTGKSRLAEEVATYQRRHGWAVLRGDCHAHTVSTPFGPWIQLLSAAFGIEQMPEVEDRSAQAVAIVRDLVPHLEDLAPLLNGLLRLAIPPNEVTRSIDDDTRRRRLTHLITEVLRAEGNRRPTAVLLRDLQWADESSIQLTNHVCENLAGSKLMACLTQRTGAELSLDLPPDSTTTIELGELDKETALQLLREVMDGEMLDEALERAILERCHGNPLYIEEVGRSLKTSGRLAVAADPGVAGGLIIPDRLQSLLMSSIDSLPATSKQVVRFAAVIGTAFELSTLNALVTAAGVEVDLPDAMEGLVWSGMVRPEEHAGSQFHFKHNLLQEVAYESLPFARRRQLHHAAAAHFESEHAGELELYYETLARHFEASGDLANTVTYAILAGDKARRMFVTDSAVMYYRRALAALAKMQGEPIRVRSQISERIGDCHEVAGRYGDAVQSYRQALREWKRASREAGEGEAAWFGVAGAEDEHAHQAELCAKLGVASERNSDFEGSLRWLDAARAAAPRKRPLLAAQVLGARSVALYRLGRFEEAIRWGKKALRVARQGGELAPLAYAHHVIANSYSEVGKLRLSVRHRTVALRLFEETADLPRLFAAHGNLALSYQALGDLAKALGHNESCLALAERVGNSTAVAITHNNMGEVLLMRGRLDEAAGHFERAVEIYRQRGEPLAAGGLALVNLSRVGLARGDLAGAELLVAEGEDLLRRTGARGLVTEAKLQRAQLALANDERPVAERLCQGILTEARGMGMQVMEARCLQVLATAAAESGRWNEAMRHLRASLALCNRAGAEYEKSLTLLGLAWLYGTDPDPARERAARHFASRAATVFARLAVDPGLERPGPV